MSNLHSRCNTGQFKIYQSPVAMVTIMSFKTCYFSNIVQFSWKEVFCSVFNPEQGYVKMFRNSNISVMKKNVKSFLKFEYFTSKIG